MKRKMRRAGLIDFDDMMVLCLELFTERKDILSALAEEVSVHS